MIRPRLWFSAAVGIILLIASGGWTIYSIFSRFEANEDSIPHTSVLTVVEFCGDVPNVRAHVSFRKVEYLIPFNWASIQQCGNIGLYISPPASAVEISMVGNFGDFEKFDSFSPVATIIPEVKNQRTFSFIEVSKESIEQIYSDKNMINYQTSVIIFKLSQEKIVKSIFEGKKGVNLSLNIKGGKIKEKYPFYLFLENGIRLDRAYSQMPDRQMEKSFLYLTGVQSFFDRDDAYPVPINLVLYSPRSETIVAIVDIVSAILLGASISILFECLLSSELYRLFVSKEK